MPTDSPGFAHTGPTAAIDSDHPEVIAYAKGRISAGDSDIGKAVKLYYAVRDDIRYDPYVIGQEVAQYKASYTLRVGAGWCVPKAVLYAAVLRAVGIPARLGFADVRNHLSTARMREQMQTDVFVWHGYVSVLLEECWVKATPAFNIELCEKFGLRPLEFNGREDSLYHAFDQAGNRHMEYLRERGEYDDLPLPTILADFAEVYGSPSLSAPESARFLDDVEREVGS